MQTASSSAPSPEAILEWLQKEMGYRSKSHAPSVDSVRKICRGNMIPVWGFLINRVKSEKTVDSIRRNITVHGVDAVSLVKEESKVKGREAAKEVERLRNLVRRQRKDLKARMLEQVMLEAYDQQCDEAARIFAEYHKRLQIYVNQARGKLSTNSERDTSVRGSKSADDDDVILAETTREEICDSFPAYEGNGVHLNPELETAKLSFEYDGEMSDEMRAVILSCLSKTQNRLQGSADTVSSHSLGGGTSQNVRNLRQLELDVWGKEREAAGLRASLRCCCLLESAATSCKGIRMATIIPACEALLESMGANGQQDLKLLLQQRRMLLC
ncbi:hypothetical protein Bca52824_061289 [Brassica carinata]|uniref:Uncharacterized protein n=1 Tax=Brassica carinata TaxID=52824 RepID=A0A8X7QXK1_BRACI|nr:hypothetical protein Bca52824_061289 [Brassica carinata]